MNLSIHLTGKNESIATITVKFQSYIDCVDFLLDYIKIK
ncbi:uncharacterized protein METZ01_LOCUS77691 [marine metagenome]|jgi:hypothetical protein|uniref:Uncharacterized protein n=1 Tax=marine metagenome TaxID=408172 RepID=A0A381UBV5_9ZZZZ